jgi:hypothetical protein
MRELDPLLTIDHKRGTLAVVSNESLEPPLLQTLTRRWTKRE